MPRGKRTIEEVRAAGYEVAFANGSVEVEEKALEEAKREAGSETVMSEAENVARDVARTAASQGVTGDALTDLVTRATTQALDSLKGAGDERVEFHERALAAAKEMPDTFVVTLAGDPETPNDDVQLYVSCKADGSGWDAGAQEILDSLVADVK